MKLTDQQLESIVQKTLDKLPEDERENLPDWAKDLIREHAQLKFQLALISAEGTLEGVKEAIEGFKPLSDQEKKARDRELEKQVANKQEVDSVLQRLLP